MGLVMSKMCPIDGSAYVIYLNIILDWYAICYVLSTSCMQVKSSCQVKFPACGLSLQLCPQLTGCYMLVDYINWRKTGPADNRCKTPHSCHSAVKASDDNKVQRQIPKVLCSHQTQANRMQKVALSSAALLQEQSLAERQKQCLPPKLPLDRQVNDIAEDSTIVKAVQVAKDMASKDTVSEWCHTAYTPSYSA